MTFGSWSKTTFRLRGQDYPYFQPDFLDYNDSERVVEVALGAKLIERYHPSRVLEVGPVLQQYVGGEHLALDKYERAPRTITCDVVNFKPDRLYDCILSLSTLEHVGFNEYGGIPDQQPDPKKIIKAIAHLKSLLAPGGLLCVTVPLGYNRPMDALLASGELRFTEQFYLKRISAENLWGEATWDEVKDCEYDAPWHAAQALLIGYERGPVAPLSATVRPPVRTVTFELHDTGPWGELSAASMMGGRERAVVRIAEELARRNYQVEIETPTSGACLKNRVTYTTKARVADAYVTVTDHAALAQTRSPVKLAWIQTGLPDVSGLDRVVDSYVVNSPAKAAYVHRQGPGTNPDRFRVIGNGVDLVDYQVAVAKVPYRLLWQSSPDRGLHHLMRWWPVLKERFPDLTLHITYKLDALEDYRWQQSLQSEWLQVIQHGLTQPGISYRGPLTRSEHLREQQEASLWVFPCEITVPGETFCISAMEMAAAGCPMLLSDDLSNREIYAGSAHFLPVPIVDDHWINAITLLLADPDQRRRFVVPARELADRFTWAALAQQWDRLLQNSNQPTVEVASESLIR